MNLHTGRLVKTFSRLSSAKAAAQRYTNISGCTFVVAEGLSRTYREKACYQAHGQAGVE